jgi:hypothetical protein
MRRHVSLRDLLATAVLAASALAWAASAGASPVQHTNAQQVVSFDARGDVDQSSVRYLEPAPASDSSRTDPRRNGSASAAFLAAFVLAAVVAVLLAAASRVSSG